MLRVMRLTFVIAVYKEEIETCMRLLGVEKVGELGLKHVCCVAVVSNIDHADFTLPGKC